MKILFVTYPAFPLEIGGFQNQVYSIAKNLNELGHKVIWYKLDEDVIDQCDIVQIMSSSSSVLPILKKAKRLNKPIVTTPMIGSRFYSNFFYKTALLFSHIPLVCSEIKKIHEIICLSDYLLPLSEFEKHRLINIFNAKPLNIETVPNGISDLYFQDIGDEAIDIDLPFENYLLIVGRIEKNKNQLSLIQAANNLKLNLIIVGEPGIDNGNHYLRKCQNISGDNIYYWGKEPDQLKLKELYRQAKLTVIPSYSEMVPLVVFESLSQKTPVICTKNASIFGETINGLFFSGISVMDLCNSINKTLKYNTDNITNDSIYSWNDIAKKYEKVYLSIKDN